MKTLCRTFPWQLSLRSTPANWCLLWRINQVRMRKLSLYLSGHNKRWAGSNAADTGVHWSVRMQERYSVFKSKVWTFISLWICTLGLKWWTIILLEKPTGFAMLKNETNALCQKRCWLLRKTGFVVKNFKHRLPSMTWKILPWKTLGWDGEGGRQATNMMLPINSNDTGGEVGRKEMHCYKRNLSEGSRKKWLLKGQRCPMRLIIKYAQDQIIQLVSSKTALNAYLHAMTITRYQIRRRRNISGWDSGLSLGMNGSRQWSASDIGVPI